jgi:hypothetical protein
MLGTVFKYRPLNERTLSIIQDRKLYFSSPADFNDPFDCDLRAITLGPLNRLQDVFSSCIAKMREIQAHEFLAHIRFMDSQSDPKEKRIPTFPFDSRLNGESALLQLIFDLTERLHSGSSHDTQSWEAAFAEFYQRLYQLARTDLGICCFSEDAQNLLMWSHYTDAHRGIVLGFDGTDRIFRRRPGISSHRVEYQLDRSVNVADVGWPESFVKLFTRKCPDWRYEKELRYVSHTGPGLVSFKRRALRSIVLGLNFKRQLDHDTSRDLARRLFETVLEENKIRPKGRKISVYASTQVADAFRISPRRVQDVRQLLVAWPSGVYTSPQPH